MTDEKVYKRGFWVLAFVLFAILMIRIIAQAEEENLAKGQAENREYEGAVFIRQKMPNLSHVQVYVARLPVGDLVLVEGRGTELILVPEFVPADFDPARTVREQINE